MDMQGIGMPLWGFRWSGKNNGLPTDTDFYDSASLTSNTFWYYYSTLLELAVTRFDWKNLPDTIDPRFLELTLISEGKALLFKDDVLEIFLGLQCTTDGKWDFYNIPKWRRAYASNGYQNVLDDTNSVIVYNNYLRMPGLQPLRMYAQRLTEIERTMDVNIIAQKTPLLIRCPETQRMTLKNVYEQYRGNQPVIFGDKNFSAEDSITVINTTAPFIAPELVQLKNQYLNDALGYLGIITQTGWKQERQTAQEVSQNNSNSVARRFSPLLMRQQAADKFNDMFPGQNVSVEFREDMTELDELRIQLGLQGMNNPNEGGNEVE